jgi:hypothetical protein
MQYNASQLLVNAAEILIQAGRLLAVSVRYVVERFEFRYGQYKLAPKWRG